VNNAIEWHQTIGVAGTFIYIGCYFMTQIGWVSTPGFLYSGLNIIAASLVGISLLYDFNLASAIIQVSWIVISMIGIVGIVLSRSNRRRRRKSRRPYELQRIR